MVYAKIIQKMIPFAGSKRFHKALSKVKMISAADGKCDAEMKVEEEDTNTFGTLHGGLSATIVDIISSCALLTHPKLLVDKLPTIRNAGISVDIHITYLKAANIGDEILIQANTIKTGNRLAFLEVTIRNKVTSDLLVKGTQTKLFGQCTMTDETKYQNVDY